MDESQWRQFRHTHSVSLSLSLTHTSVLCKSHDLCWIYHGALTCGKCVCLHLCLIVINFTIMRVAFRGVFNVVCIIFCMLYFDLYGEKLCVFLPGWAFGKRIMMFGLCVDIKYLSVSLYIHNWDLEEGKSTDVLSWPMDWCRTFTGLWITRIDACKGDIFYSKVLSSLFKKRSWNSTRLMQKDPSTLEWGYWGAE